MTENSHRPSAKIYQFPVGGRAGLVGAREAVRPAVDAKPVDRMTKAVAGSDCWYHEAAIEDAARPSTRDRD